MTGPALRASEAAVLALDVGGTKIAGALVDAVSSAVLHRAERPAPRGRVDGTLREAVRELAAEAADRGLRLVGAGAGFPEYTSPDGLLTSREVLDWVEQPAALLARALPADVPVRIESDVRCGALGEARRGAGAGLPSFLYVSLGTGLSSALVLDGRPLPGARGEAIALGEFDVPPSVDPGWTGTLERYASGAGIGERLDVPGAREAAAAAAGGDPRAARILETAGRALGTVLARTVRLLDPAAVILGGGLGCAELPALHGPLRAAWRSALDAAGRPSPPPLLTAATGADAGLLGAAEAAVAA